MEVFVGSKIVHKVTGRTATIKAVSPATNPLTGEMTTLYSVQLPSGKTKTVEEGKLSREWSTK